MKKIITIIGARPQFIKAAPVSRAIGKNNSFSEILVHTGQHYDPGMSAVFFRDLEIPEPAYNLGVGSGTHGAQTGEILKKLDDVFLNEKPDMVLVYGDTNSTLAGALSASKLHIPVAHVEAGLRSHNKAMPEEINRIVTDHVSDLLFAPTPTAVENLRNEGIIKGVVRTGDVMYDTALIYMEKAKSNTALLRSLNISEKSYILSTIHRAENTDDPEKLKNIFSALSAFSKRCSIVMPLHPRTLKMIDSDLLGIETGTIIIIPPVGFLEMIALESNACLIATDSGGVQKEAYFYKVPCVTLRTETEWVETIEAGWNRLADTRDKDSIIEALEQGLNGVGDKRQISVYGSGTTAFEIVASLDTYLKDTAPL